MSNRLRVLLLVLVIVGALIAVRMIHRRKLNLGYSLLWLALALLLVIAVVFPQTVYALSALIGIDLPINFLLTAFALFSLVMMFYLTCIVSRESEKNRTLTQQLALLEKRLRDLEADVSARKHQKS